MAKTKSKSKSKKKSSSIEEMVKYGVEKGYAKVYFPNLPLKHGYKKICFSPYKPHYGVRCDLTPDEKKLVTSCCQGVFFNGDLLRWFLINKCNVQNPDELTWDTILNFIRIHRLEHLQNQTPDPLTPKACLVFELLVNLPPHKGMTKDQIAEAIDNKHEVDIDSTFSNRIQPQLKPWGLQNKRGVGYYIRQKK